MVKDVRNATLLRRIDSNFKILKKTSKERIIRTFSYEKRVCAKRVDLKENIIYRTAFVESQIINFLQVIREHFPAKQNSFGEWNFFIPHFVLALQSCNHALTLNPELITEQEPNHSQKNETVIIRRWKKVMSWLTENCSSYFFSALSRFFFLSWSLYLSLVRSLFVSLKQKDIILPSKLLAC